MPISSFQVDVNAPPSVVVERLRAVVEPPSWLGFRTPWSPRDPSHPFIGTVRDSSFEIRRDIRSRNSFLPIVRGRISPTPMGTRVEVAMSIPLFSAIFVVIFFVAAAKLMIAFNPGIVNSVPVVTDTFGFLITLGAMLIVVAMFAWGFFPEVAKARELLTRAVLNPSITELELQSTPDGY